MNRSGTLFVFALQAVLSPVIRADVVNFDNLNDTELVTTQYTGLTFTNTIVLTAGVSLNEFEFPPHSGTNVASDLGGPIQIDFSSPVSGFSAYFTYLVPLTLTAFDSSNMTIGSVTSAFSSNLALSGDPGSSPNEQLGFSSPVGISRVTILGDPGGGSFTMDDVAFEPASPTAVPEPSAGILILAIFVMAGLAGRLQKPRSQETRMKGSGPLSTYSISGSAINGRGSKENGRGSFHFSALYSA